MVELRSTKTHRIAADDDPAMDEAFQFEPAEPAELAAAAAGVRHRAQPLELAFRAAQLTLTVLPHAQVQKRAANLEGQDSNFCKYLRNKFNNYVLKVRGNELQYCYVKRK
jgi:hypothetical protein